MNVEEKLISLVNDFISRYSKISLDEKKELLNLNELYYNAHFYIKILSIIERNEQIEVFEEKLKEITEAILELEA